MVKEAEKYKKKMSKIEKELNQKMDESFVYNLRNTTMMKKLKKNYQKKIQS